MWDSVTDFEAPGHPHYGDVPLENCDTAEPVLLTRLASTMLCWPTTLFFCD